MPRRALRAAMALCAVLGGCTGRIGEPSATDPLNPGPGPVDPNNPNPTCEGVLSAAVPLRRINDLQYKKTITDIFDRRVAPSEAFPATTLGLGYTTYAEANVLSQLGTEQLLEAAVDVAEAVVGALPQLLPCAAEADEACARTFIDTYAARAFRRPLRNEERDILLGLFRQTRMDTPFPESIGVVAMAILQMPQFLYLIEEQRDSGPVQKLDSYELASRLAYFMWNTMPDEALLAAAASGELEDRAGLEREVRRMLADERASDMIAQFFREWIDLGELANGKDRSVYPEWNAVLWSSMEQEVERFVAHVIREKGGTLEALLTSNETFVNRPLAELYGLDPSISPGPNDWRLVSLDSTRRAGLLTKAGLLAAKAHASSTSPVFRGKFVRTQLLCDEIPAPPADAMSMPPNYPPNATQREKSDILTATQPCGGCHALMNPIGVGFEHYDALGKWRANDTNGAAINATGHIQNGAVSEFNGIVDLSRKLATSDDARDCIVRHWFRYSLGTRETANDACTIQRLDEDLAAQNYSLPELIVSIATSDAFMNRGMR